ncbi:MAG: tRNA 2-thiouridine(34) synthase MnmA [Rhabdochlamydiaceae bacterium]
MNHTVIVGMSGGVDSSVTALLLKQQGYNVISLFMKNWEEKNAQGVCLAEQDYEDVRKVCDQIDIPYYGVNFVEEYQNQVFAYFLKDLQAGYTPNPDVLCNREIKFKVFLEKAKQLGADFLATGHYARILQGENHHFLQKGKDPHKDQSYFLYTLKETILKNVLFPIGNYHKKEIREIAKKHHLATADKKDSTGICFIGKRNFKQFLQNYLPYQKGEFKTLSGKTVGHHEGTAYYTIGQRKGLGIGGQGDAWFVVDKDVSQNLIFVEQGHDHPSLYQLTLTASDLSWVNESPSIPFQCTAKIRYRQEDQPCYIEKIEDGIAHVRFLNPQRAITPHQSIVFYQNDRCLGGGLIN